MTPQQAQIVSVIKAKPGLKAKQIARLINASHGTVECQIKRIVKSGELQGAILANGYVLRPEK